MSYYIIADKGLAIYNPNDQNIWMPGKGSPYKHGVVPVSRINDSIWARDVKTGEKLNFSVDTFLDNFYGISDTGPTLSNDVNDAALRAWFNDSALRAWYGPSYFENPSYWP